MNYLYVSLVVAGLVVIEVLIGGTRLLFCLPGYGFIAAAGVASIATLRRRTIPANAPCLISSVLFASYLLIRAIRSPVAYLAWTDLFMVLAAMLVYLLTALHLTAPKHRYGIIGALLVLAAAQIVIGIIQFTRGDDFMLFDFLRRAASGKRSSGFYISPNHLAGFLEVVAVLGMSLATLSRLPAARKILVGYISLGCWAGVLLTGSRGGYVSALASALVFLFLLLRAVRRSAPERFVKVAIVTFVAALIALTAVGYFIFLNDYVRSRASTVIEPGNMRIQLWKGALQEFLIAPVFGTGSGTYLYYGRLFRPSNIVPDPVYVHNDYLHLLAEYGIAGVATFLFFLGAHLRAGWKAFRWIVEERLPSQERMQSGALALNVGALASISAYMVHSAFDFNLHIPSNALMISFVFGILANPGVERPDTSSRDRSLSFGAKFMLPVLALWLLFTGMPKLPGEYYTEKARTSLRDGHYEQAARFAEEGIAHEKRNPNLFDYLGAAQGARAEMESAPAGQTALREAAADAYRKGVALFPQDTRLLNNLGDTLNNLGRFEEAEPFVRDAVRWDPNSPVTHAALGEHYRLHGEFEKARTELDLSMQLRRNAYAEAQLHLLNGQSATPSNDANSAGK